jgi:TonB-dependent SusC/RagA subfamily outer membrane receptor
VEPGWHSIRLRTTRQQLSLDSVFVARGSKTVISLRADTTWGKAFRELMPDTLTSGEQAVLGGYLLAVENNTPGKLSYIRQNGQVFLVRSPFMSFGHGAGAGVGPINRRPAEYVVHNSSVQPFEPEEGYEFRFTPGLIRQKQPARPLFRNYLFAYGTPPNTGDYVLSEQKLDSLWREYQDQRCASVDLFVNPAVARGVPAGELQVVPGKDERGWPYFIKSLFLFRYGHTDFLHVYKGNTRHMGRLEPGYYRLLVLLKGNRYYLMDSLPVRAGGMNYFDPGKVKVVGPDSVSVRLARILSARASGQRYYEGNDKDDIREIFHERYLDPSGFTRFVSGVVRDAEGRPVIGAVVSIRGTRLAAQTDAQGGFLLAAPEQATIVVTSVGFAPVEALIEGREHLDLTLTRSVSQLQEIVVVGYGTTRRREMTGAVATVSGDSYLLQGKVAGIAVRGQSSMQAGMPILMLDGQPYDGSLNTLDTAAYSITVLDGPAATALYGSRGAGGVILLTPKKGGGPTDAAEGNNANSLRRRFRDDAFWQPRLRTDESGKARFTVTYPDDITSWRAYVIAMGSRRRTGLTETKVRSFKPLSGNLALPLFLVSGDSATGIAKALYYGIDSQRVASTLTIDSTVVDRKDFFLRHSRIDTVHLFPGVQDSVRVRYSLLKEDGYLDGEERGIPVFRPGVQETKGVFAALEGDTSLTLDFDPALGPVKVHAEAALLPVFVEEMEAIRRYEYLCNEQMASKLKALLLERSIRRHLGEPFRDENTVRQFVRQLTAAGKKTGWGWWPGDEEQPWISLHVADALLQAEAAGFPSLFDKRSLADYLIYRMGSAGQTVSDALFALQLLHRLEAKAPVDRYLEELAPKVEQSTLFNRLRWMELRQLTGSPVRPDSLLAKARRTAMGNLYWGEENRSLFNNPVQNTLVMYRLLNRAGGHEAVLRRIRGYFLEQRKSGHWSNTYESSLILETLLPDLLRTGADKRQPVLQLSGGRQETVTRFPYTAEWSAGDTLRAEKTGGAPVYFTAYQQLWNSRPALDSNVFAVRSRFLKNGSPVTVLPAGEAVTLEVSVSVTADVDYVLVEIPIPAGCSYAVREQPHRYGEVHREHFKHKVSLFCTRLTTGTYTFSVQLLPRYTGRYVLNPARAEMMYFPVFSGREGMKNVSIR